MSITVPSVNPFIGINDQHRLCLFWIVLITLLLHDKIAGQEDNSDNEEPAAFCGYLRFETNPVTILNISEREVIDRDVFLKVHKKFANSSVAITNPLCQIQICGYSAGITSVFGNTENPRCNDFSEADTIVESIPYTDQYEITAISCGCQKTEDSHYDCHNFDYCSMLVSPYLCANLYQEEKCKTCTHKEIELEHGAEFRTQNSAVITSANVRENCTLTRKIYGEKWKEKRRQEFLILGNSFIEPNFYQRSDEYTCACEDIVDDFVVTTATVGDVTNATETTTEVSGPMESWTVAAISISAVVVVLLCICTPIGVYVYKHRSQIPSTVITKDDGTRDPGDGLLNPTFLPLEPNGVSLVYDTMDDVCLNVQDELVIFKPVKDDSLLLDKYSTLFAAQIDPKFIIDWKYLEFGRPLGMGQFGEVIEGTVNIPELEIVARRVAFKTIRNLAIGSDKMEYVLSLINELKVYSHIGRHTNLVEFLGASMLTEDSQERSCQVLIMELCGEQNLKEYLTSQRPRLRRSLPEAEASPPPLPPVPGYVAISEPVDKPVITVYDEIDPELFRKLLHFSKGIAAGMGYLHSKNVLHKDLAARNVLLSLSENPEPKISDFGSSRKLYGKDYYKRGKGRVALSWIAPEYISESKFTFESDVWAYGVTLWEIFNLGKDPDYPVDQSNMDLFVIGLRNFLSSQKRLKRPEFATPEIYNKILNCWKYDPKLRPSFTELQTFFEDLLEG